MLKINKQFYFLVTIAVIGVVLLLKFSPYKLTKDAGSSAPKPPVAVNVIKINSQVVENFEELPGRIAAFKFAEIRPQIDGIINQRNFVEGAKVAKGQQLYQIDPAIYQANYNSAKAALQEAKANLKAVVAKNQRLKQMVEIEAISKQEFEDNVANLEQAKAKVAIAEAAMKKEEISLNYTKVLAPIAGNVAKSFVTEGSLVQANQAQILTTITQLDPIYIDIARSSEGLSKIYFEANKNKKLPVELYLSDGTVYKRQGVLQFSGVNIDPSTGSVEMRAVFKNPEQMLLPGGFVKVKIKLSSQKVILIPKKAAVRNPDGSLSVWLVNEKNIVKPLIIKAVEGENNQYIVTEGLVEGDVIVVEGFQKISPDALVTPVFPENLPK